MTWVRNDDKARTHPKVLRAGPLAAWLNECGKMWAAEHLTDGVIPEEVVATLADFRGALMPCRTVTVTPARLEDGRPIVAGVTVDPDDLAAVLVQVGLWERVEGGFRVHDYLDYNPSKRDVLADRRAARRRMARVRDTFGEGSGEVQAPPTPTPSPTPSPPRGENENNTPPPSGFEGFWAAYPRKVSKRDALQAWQRLEPDVVLQAHIVAALDAQKTWPAWTKDAGRFIPHPATWLNGRRWEDEPPAPTGRPARARLDDAWEGRRSGEVSL